MTNAIIFFQSFQTMFLFKNFVPTNASKQEIKLAVWLKREAESLEAIADQEMKNGAAAQELAAGNETEKARVFGEIAVWHLTRAADKYRQAAARYAEAGTIQTNKRGTFNAAAMNLRQLAGKAESAINSTNGLTNEH